MALVLFPFLFFDVKLLLYPHGGSGNHGCEAIVRSTRTLTKADITLMSSCVEEDLAYGLGNVCLCLPDSVPMKKTSLLYAKAVAERYLFGNANSYDLAHFSPIFRNARKADLVLSIGGDNYCYGTPDYIYLQNRQFQKMGKKTVLWGCSIDPDRIDSRMLDDLKCYSKIIARESLTYRSLTSLGLPNVSLYPDPAFCLGSSYLPLPDGFIEGNTVGINVSPMVISHEMSAGAVMNNYKELIAYILHESDMNVALIPHVVWPHNDDREPLRILYDLFKDSGRIVMIEDHNAEELKGYIARCRFMIAARTHASIAAYSSKVPTLVVGYSIKARGIAADIFGDERNYILPVQQLMNPGQLCLAFKWLVRNEQEINSHYGQMMDDYIGSLGGLKSSLL